MKPIEVKTSKFLSFVLRHRPEAIGLSLDSKGWASVSELLELAQAAGRNLTFETLRTIVETNDKQRFHLSEDGRRIRANQGHSVTVNLELEAATPPERLYHGTAERFLDSILEVGLEPRGRHHVHLSSSVEVAKRVGARHGKAVVLKVKAAEMAGDGFEFYLSRNGVWLTGPVPPRYLSLRG